MEPQGKHDEAIKREEEKLEQAYCRIGKLVVELRAAEETALELEGTREGLQSQIDYVSELEERVCGGNITGVRNSSAISRPSHGRYGIWKCFCSPRGSGTPNWRSRWRPNDPPLTPPKRSCTRDEGALHETG